MSPSFYFVRYPSLFFLLSQGQGGEVTCKLIALLLSGSLKNSFSLRKQNGGRKERVSMSVKVGS